MASRIALTVILTASMVFSCAPKKEVVKQAGPVQPEEEFRLPEAPRPEPKPATKRPKPFEPVLLEEGREKYILLNFDDTDIRTIISTFSELLEINYILTPGITGKVTIQSYRKFPVKDLFPVFQSILELNGLTAVREGEFYKIVPIDTAKQQPLEVAKGKEPETRLDSTFITQLLPLEYVNASDISNILRNLMPRGTDIIVYEPANMLIVTSLPKTLVKFMKIIEALDITETESETVRTFVYYVENGDAAKLEGILSTVYSGGKSKRPSAAPRTSPVRRTAGTPARSAARQALPGDIGEISITAYEDINGLIIKATPRAYLSLLEVLKKIDVPARQVLIEVLIAEVTLSDSFKFGLEWLVKSRSGDVYGLNLGGVNVPPNIPAFPAANIFGAVITDSLGSATYNSVIKALAMESKLNVLASPHILAVDNKEAQIEIGDEVPIATGLTQQPSTGTGGTTLVSTGQIQYKTVGTILTVKPRITEKGMVSMEITQEVSQIGADVLVSGQEFASFSTRKATTTAIVQSGHTLIIGGMIREAKDRARAGIPFLSKIPLLGYLFSSTSDDYEKTELLVMVTPHVISNQDEADALTERFQNRVKTIKKRIKAFTDKNKENAPEEEAAGETPPLQEDESAPDEK